MYALKTLHEQLKMVKLISLTSVSEHSQHLGQKKSHILRECVRECVCESPAGGELQFLSVQMFLFLISPSACVLRQWAGLPGGFRSSVY